MAVPICSRAYSSDPSEQEVGDTFVEPNCSMVPSSGTRWKDAINARNTNNNERGTNGTRSKAFYKVRRYGGII